LSLADLSLANAPTIALEKAGRSSGLRLDTNVFGPREHSTTSLSTRLDQRPGAWQITGDRLACVEEAPAEFDLLDAFGRHQERNSLAVQ